MAKTLFRLVLGFLVICLVGFPRSKNHAATYEENSVVLSAPYYVAGFSGYGDQRDVDIYPAAAYDPTTGRYLVVWASPVNAASSSDGFDVYGVFLDSTGNRQGNPFRISDTNTVARSTLPAVASGPGEFLVAWAKRGSPCKVALQRVTSSLPQSDITLIGDASRGHSPSLIYLPDRNRYIMVYVDGEDYLPPSIYGAETGDCGNNPASKSIIKAVELIRSGSGLANGDPFAISSESKGSFRPKVTYDQNKSRVLVVWEDRRESTEKPYSFRVYAQLLNNQMFRVGGNVAISEMADYANEDSSATWTPRPTVSAGEGQFLTAWFIPSSNNSGSGRTWTLQGRLLGGNEELGDPFDLAKYSFAHQHPDAAPSGFLSSAYIWSAKEWIVGFTTHLESLWGYRSFVLLQRINAGGQLLDQDGNVLTTPAIGFSLDNSSVDQIAVALAANPTAGMRSAHVVAIYGKNAPNKNTADMDIWAVRIQLPTPYMHSVALPVVIRGR